MKMTNLLMLLNVNTVNVQVDVHLDNAGQEQENHVPGEQEDNNLSPLQRKVVY